ncbi:hypothetical protein RQP46_010174 [Phenoliferia psychrophenolica]
MRCSSITAVLLCFATATLARPVLDKGERDLFGFLGGAVAAVGAKVDSIIPVINTAIPVPVLGETLQVNTGGTANGAHVQLKCATGNPLIPCVAVNEHVDTDAHGAIANNLGVYSGGNAVLAYGQVGGTGTKVIVTAP